MPNCCMCGKGIGQKKGDHKRGVTLHSGCKAGSWIGVEAVDDEPCIDGYLLTRIGSEVKCVMCNAALSAEAVQKWGASLSKEENAVAQPTRNKAIIWFREISQPPDSQQLFIDENQQVFDPRLGWQGFVPCVKEGCAAILGVSEGCDLITCPACKRQQNMIKGDKSHTFLMQPFLAGIKKFTPKDTRGAWKVFRSQHKEVWAALHFEDLIQRLTKAQASGNDDLVKDLSDRVSPDWPGFQAYLKTRFKPRDQAKTSTAKSSTPKIPAMAASSPPAKVAPAKVGRQVLPPKPAVRPVSPRTPPSLAGKSASASGPGAVGPAFPSIKDRLAFFQGEPKPKVVNVAVLKKK